ncbi:MAG: hypothetical protein KDC92_10730, partial [Bacteroidetes bacterium]|nr:hypothetical protein [Bacteroidota bacterium]
MGQKHMDINSAKALLDAVYEQLHSKPAPIIENVELEEKTDSLATWLIYLNKQATKLGLQFSLKTLAQNELTEHVITYTIPTVAFTSQGNQLIPLLLFKEKKGIKVRDPLSGDMPVDLNFSYLLRSNDSACSGLPNLEKSDNVLVLIPIGISETTNETDLTPFKRFIKLLR